MPDRIEAEFQLRRCPDGTYRLRLRDYKAAIEEREIALTRSQGAKVRDVLFPIVLDAARGKVARPS